MVQEVDALSNKNTRLKKELEASIQKERIAHMEELERYRAQMVQQETQSSPPLSEEWAGIGQAP